MEGPRFGKRVMGTLVALGLVTPPAPPADAKQTLDAEPRPSRTARFMTPPDDSKNWQKILTEEQGVRNIVETYRANVEKHQLTVARVLEYRDKGDSRGVPATPQELARMAKDRPMLYARIMEARSIVWELVRGLEFVGDLPGIPENQYRSTFEAETLGTMQIVNANSDKIEYFFPRARDDAYAFLIEEARKDDKK